MSVKYIRGAEEGTGSIEDLLATLSGGAQEQQGFENDLALLSLLERLGMGNQPQRVQAPVGDMLGEQRQRAELAAGSIHPDAQFQPGMNPGGLYDLLSGFIGGLGVEGTFGRGPQLEEAYRKAPKVPLEQLGGGSFEGAMDLARQAAASSVEVPAQANAYQPTIDTLVQNLIKRAAGETTPADQVSSGEAARQTGLVSEYQPGEVVGGAVEDTTDLVSTLLGRLRQQREIENTPEPASWGSPEDYLSRITKSGARTAQKGVKKATKSLSRGFQGPR